MRRWIDRPMLHLCTSRILAEEIIAIPIRRRSDRPRNKSAAAIRTDISQDLFDTGRTERALIRADPRLKRLRRQRPVAMFACRSEFKHGVLDVRLPRVDNYWANSFALINLQIKPATRPL